MAIYKLKGKKTKYFFDLYKGSKYFGKSVTSRTCGEILSNLIIKVLNILNSLKNYIN